jgi:hypothetical protein
VVASSAAISASVRPSAISDSTSSCCDVSAPLRRTRGVGDSAPSWQPK